MNKVKELKKEIENNSRIININNIEYNKKNRLISILRAILFALIIEVCIVAIFIVTKKNKILFFGTIINIICTSIYTIYLALNPVDSSIHYNAKELSEVTGREIQQKIANNLLPSTCEK